MEATHAKLEISGTFFPHRRRIFDQKNRDKTGISSHRVPARLLSEKVTRAGKFPDSQNSLNCATWLALTNVFYVRV
jgi:hypothetical protein